VVRLLAISLIDPPRSCFYGHGNLCVYDVTIALDDAKATDPERPPCRLNQARSAPSQSNRTDGSLPRGVSDTAARLGCRPKTLTGKLWSMRHGHEPAIYELAPFRQSNADFWTAGRVAAFNNLVSEGRLTVSAEEAAKIVGANRWPSAPGWRGRTSSRDRNTVMSSPRRTAIS
jgi:hypothetical protein